MRCLRPYTTGVPGLFLAMLLALTTACSGPGPDSGAGPGDGSGTDGPSGHAQPPTPPPGTRPGTVRPPAADAVFDYQIGGAYEPAATVRVVSRDRTAKPAPGLYNICYVNAFQTQPGQDIAWWKDQHPDLLLKGATGEPVVDEDWMEPLLDISTPAKRDALMNIIGAWIDGCAQDGYDAVEADNLDSYERSDGALTAEHAAAFAGLLARRAHARNMAIGQKNATDLLPLRERIGFDFAVVEECAHYGECAAFTKTYDGRVFDIEYAKKDFEAGCEAHRKGLSITLRDHEVVPAGQPEHVYRHC